MAAIVFDNDLPTIIADDGRHVQVPAEIVAQADDELDIIECCRRYAIKAGLTRKQVRLPVPAAA